MGLRVELRHNWFRKDFSYLTPLLSKNISHLRLMRLSRVVSHFVHHKSFLVFNEMLFVLFVLVERSFRSISLTTPTYKSSFDCICSSSEPLLSFVIWRICSIILLIVRALSHVFTVWISIIAFNLTLVTCSCSSLLLLCLLELSKCHISWVWGILSLRFSLLLRHQTWVGILKMILRVTISLRHMLLLHILLCYSTWSLWCYLSIYLTCKGCKGCSRTHRIWWRLLLGCISLLLLLS